MALIKGFLLVLMVAASGQLLETAKFVSALSYLLQLERDVVSGQPQATEKASA